MEWKPFIFCDTAGIRHRSKHDASVEVFIAIRGGHQTRRSLRAGHRRHCGSSHPGQENCRAHSEVWEALRHRVEQVGSGPIPSTARFRTLARTGGPRPRKTILPGPRADRRPVGEDARAGKQALYDDRKDPTTRADEQAQAS